MGGGSASPFPIPTASTLNVICPRPRPRPRPAMLSPGGRWGQGRHGDTSILCSVPVFPHSPSPVLSLLPPTGHGAYLTHSIRFRLYPRA